MLVVNVDDIKDIQRDTVDGLFAKYVDNSIRLDECLGFVEACVHDGDIKVYSTSEDLSVEAVSPDEFIANLEKCGREHHTFKVSMRTSELNEGHIGELLRMFPDSRDTIEDALVIHVLEGGIYSGPNDNSVLISPNKALQYIKEHFA